MGRGNVHFGCRLCTEITHKIGWVCVRACWLYFFFLFFQLNHANTRSHLHLFAEGMVWRSRWMLLRNEISWIESNQQKPRIEENTNCTATNWNICTFKWISFVERSLLVLCCCCCISFDCRSRWGTDYIGKRRRWAINDVSEKLLENISFSRLKHMDVTTTATMTAQRLSKTTKKWTNTRNAKT